MVVSELALGLITNALYDSAKNTPGICTDPSTKVYNNAIKELNKKYGQSGEKVNVFLHQENIRGAIRGSLENPKNRDLLKSLTDEFLKSFYNDNFSREYAKSILNAFFEILDVEIKKDPELRSYLQLHLTTEIHQTEKETNEVVQEIRQDFKDLCKVIIDNKADTSKKGTGTDFEESITRYINKIVAEDNKIRISEVFLPMTLRSLDKKRGKTQEVEVFELVKELVKEKEKIIVISGGSGSGKTTTLKWLNVTYAANFLENKDEYIPLYIELNSYNKGSFYDYLSVKAEGNGIKKNLLKNY